LMEIAGLYAAFPRLGTAVTPHVVRGAVGRDGVLMDRDGVASLGREPEDRRAFDAESAYLVHALLEGVVERGTARRLRTDGFTGPLAGKTGTTNDYRDAWYVGYSPDLLGAAWVGFDDGRPVKLPASATALEIWETVMRPILVARDRGRFAVPPGITFVEVDGETGLRADASCPGMREAFRAGTEPTDYCGPRRRDGEPPDLDPLRGHGEPLAFPKRLFEEWTREMRRIFGPRQR